MIEKYASHSAEETEAFAEKFACRLKENDVVAFVGSLGMGKTCFTRGLCRGIGFSGDVTSPTFAIVNEYIGGRLAIRHFDMYRVGSWEELYSTGYFDYLEAGGVTVIEWSENIKNALPENCISVTLEKTGESSRLITVDWGDRR